MRFRAALSWSLLGGLGAGGLLFAQMIFAGRLLGPEQFGTFSLVQTLAMVLLIPCLAGFDMSTSRALSQASSDAHRLGLAASSIAAVLACSASTVLLVLGAADPIAEVLGTRAAVVLWAAPFTVLLAQRWLMERQLSGLGRFREQAGVRILEAFVTIGTFAALQITGALQDWRSLVVAYAAGAVVVTVGAHLVDGQAARPRHVDWGHVRSLLAYSWLMNGAYIFSTLLFQADRFAVNGILGVHALGVYSAYYAATIFVVIQVLLIVSNVLYPTMARTPDKRIVVSRLDRFAPIAAVLGTTFLLGLLAAVLRLFGDDFPFHLGLGVLFSIWAVLAGINGTYAVIVNAHDERSCAREVAFQPVRLVFLVAWFAVLGTAGQLTLTLSATGMLLAEVLEAVNLRIILRRHVLVHPGTVSSVAGVEDGTTAAAEPIR